MEEKKHIHKQYLEHKQESKHRGYETATWIFGIATAILVVLLVASILTRGFVGGSGVNTVSSDTVKTKSIAFLNNMFQAQGQTATITIDNITDQGDLYNLKININGQIYDSFARKDGSLLFPTGFPLDQKAAPAANNNAAASPAAVENIPKTDKPKVELFVMSYCPYGTQAEKGILPAVRALGDKVDFKIRFVYYSMHGDAEVQENLRQYCIQKDMPDKFDAYLACFLNATDSPGCLKSTGIDEAALKTCTDATDTQFNVTKNFNDKTSWLNGRYPLFSTDAGLNTQYGVGGSPTLVINGVQSNAGRDSASFLAGICNTFNNKPAECGTQLSAVSPGPGFGYDSTAAATAAGCGV